MLLMISLRSKLTQRLLLFFFLNPLEERYLCELAKILQVKPQNLHKKLKDLEEEGLFQSEMRGQERHYFLDVEWPLYLEYRSIFKKTLGVPSLLAESLGRVRHLREVYVRADYRSLVEDVEVLVVQSKDACHFPSKNAISVALGPLKKELGRKIRVVFSEDSLSDSDEEWLKIL